MKKVNKWLIAGALCLGVFLATVIEVKVQQNNLYDQTFARRWSGDDEMCQFSLIYPVERKGISEFSCEEIKHNILSKIESDIEMTDYPDTLSVKGRISLISDKSSMDITAIGISGDFFQFHPIALRSGSYIDADDLMKDGIVIDEMVAWNLFGSSDVEGMEVFIGNTPYYIKGVVHKPEDRFSREAGLEEPICYVNLDTLISHGYATGSYVYEMVIPNLVEGYGERILREVLGEEVNSLKLVDNSHRYSIKNLGIVLGEYGVRSMSRQGYIFPYFENIARAWEDVFSLILLFEIILVIVIFVIGIRLVVFLVKSKVYELYKEKRMKLWRNVKEYLELHFPL